MIKMLLDFLPLVLFFGSYHLADAHKDWAAAFATEHFGFMIQGGAVGPDQAPVLLSTIVVTVATIAQVIALRLMKHKIDAMLWISLVLVVIFGGATVYFHNDAFIKWKPTVLYWIMGAVLWGVPVFTGRNMLQSMMGGIELPQPVWKKLNWMWVAFFVVMGVANIAVAYSFSTDAWVSFKSFGATGMMLAFVLGQGVWLGKVMDAIDAEEKAKKAAVAAAGETAEAEPPRA